MGSVEFQLQAENEDPDFKVEEKEPTCDEEVIWFFLRRLVKEMADKLDQRTESERKTAAGRAQTVTFQQTRLFLKPFFKKCRTRTVEVSSSSLFIFFLISSPRRTYSSSSLKSSGTVSAETIRSALFPLPSLSHSLSGRQ